MEEGRWWTAKNEGLVTQRHDVRGLFCREGSTSNGLESPKRKAMNDIRMKITRRDSHETTKKKRKTEGLSRDRLQFDEVLTPGETGRTGHQQQKRKTAQTSTHVQNKTDRQARRKVYGFPDDPFNGVAEDNTPNSYACPK
ncbi:hypothetical protein RUM44_009351 [Polyplax serrata]|uniref:Uncharacterized protein n=1 Tax=Polyplax serrata TaxID=468196 RepID=A0ABR1ASG0_POLSC